MCTSLGRDDKERCLNFIQHNQTLTSVIVLDMPPVGTPLPMPIRDYICLCFRESYLADFPGADLAEGGDFQMFSNLVGFTPAGGALDVD